MEWVSNFVRVLCIEVVFNAFSAGFVEILWGDLDQVRDLGLRMLLPHESSSLYRYRLTRMNMGSAHNRLVLKRKSTKPYRVIDDRYLPWKKILIVAKSAAT